MFYVCSENPDPPPKNVKKKKPLKRPQILNPLLKPYTQAQTCLRYGSMISHLLSCQSRWDLSEKELISCLASVNHNSVRAALISTVFIEEEGQRIKEMCPENECDLDFLQQMKRVMWPNSVVVITTSIFFNQLQFCKYVFVQGGDQQLNFSSVQIGTGNTKKFSKQSR